MTELTCRWDDQGLPCPCYGVIGFGPGQMYCREHWDRLNKRDPKGVGNYNVEPLSNRGPWEGWKYNSDTKRLEREIDLNQFEDVLPETEQV